MMTNSKWYAARVLYSILFYVLAMALLIASQPRAVFNDDRSPRAFGVGPGKTVFSLGVVAVSLAILSFYMFALIDLVLGA